MPTIRALPAPSSDRICWIRGALELTSPSDGAARVRRVGSRLGRCLINGPKHLYGTFTARSAHRSRWWKFDGDDGLLIVPQSTPSPIPRMSNATEPTSEHPRDNPSHQILQSPAATFQTAWLTPKKNSVYGVLIHLGCTASAMTTLKFRSTSGFFAIFVSLFSRVRDTDPRRIRLFESFRC